MTRSAWMLATLAFAFVPAASGQQPTAPASTDRPQTAAHAAPPLSPQELERRADLFMARKRYPEAIEIYLRLVKKDQKNAALLNRIGMAYQHEGNLSQAKRYYERAIRADKTFFHAINNLGTVHYYRRNYRQAIRAYQRALALRSDVAVLHSNLGYAYFAQKKYDEALAAFQRAIEIDPGLFERRGTTGSMFQQSLMGDRALFFFFLAKSYAAMGNAERCAFYLRKARDEGYKKLAEVNKDPTFAAVLNDPLVQEALRPVPGAGANPPGLQ